MQTSTRLRDDPRVSLGNRRGISDLARFSLDLSWARADSASTARSESYPSPPMSGSPPLPPKTSQEDAERSQGGYLATTQDVYRGVTTAQGDDRLQQTVIPTPSRGFPSEAQDRITYGFHHPEGPIPIPRPPPYSQQLTQASPQQSYLPPVPVVGTAGSAARPLPGGPTAYSSTPAHPTQEVHHPSTSKPQRKTKGHVASACVPCKKAHLRFVLFQTCRLICKISYWWPGC